MSRARCSPEGARDNRLVPPGKTNARLSPHAGPGGPSGRPKEPPDLNDLPPEWKTLKADPLADRTFKNVANRKTAIAEAIEAMNQNRQPRSLANRRTSA
jgi:hypothetical protein